MSEQKIVIQELGKPAEPGPKVDLGLDLQDVLILIGVASGEVAAFIVWPPASLILLCLFCFGFLYLIEKAAAKEAALAAVKARKK
jgi:hypothetical protein